MNKYHVVLNGSPKGANFVLHRETLEEAQEKAKEIAESWSMSVSSVTFIGEVE